MPVSAARWPTTSGHYTVAVENLKDLYSAESQLLKALPKVAKKVENEQLRQALQQHLVETEACVKARRVGASIAFRR